MYDRDEEIYADPVVSEVDVIGLFPSDAAAAASRATACDPGSGPTRIDD
jgi:hypothetical protein